MVAGCREASEPYGRIRAARLRQQFLRPTRISKHGRRLFAAARAARRDRAPRGRLGVLVAERAQSPALRTPRILRERQCADSQTLTPWKSLVLRRSSSTSIAFTHA